jgi:Tol biopolymer transport system component/C-terminal processing protease CtpA/Prc
MHKRFILAAALLLAPAAAVAQTRPTWLRYPAISPDGRTIVFTWRGDLYRVPSTGGTAVALTAHAAMDFMPVWSRDGRQIAFASDRYGNFDVFVVPATGGAARRITHHSAPEYPYTFGAGDSTVIFGAARMDAASNRLYPTASQPELYEVPATGGRPLQLLTTPAEDVKLGVDGRTLFYHDRKGGENAWRKHQTSAIARDLWAYDLQKGTHRKLTSFVGEDRTPVPTADGRALHSLSEASGSFNVHRMNLDGSASEQVTSFTGAPVRFLSAATDGTLAFGHDGAIYTMRPGGAPQPVSITLHADAKANPDRVVPVTGGAREMALSPNGKEIAFVARGDVFVTSVEGGVTKRITRTPEQEVGVTFSPDGKAIAYASERGGRWAIYEARRARESEPYFYASTLVRETPLVANERQNYQPAWSPDGRELAFIEDRNTLRVLNLATKQVRTLLTEREIFSSNPNHTFSWSPDGRWMLFDMSVPGIAPGEVGIVATDGKSPAINLTRNGFSDRAAKWVNGGSTVLWFSNRDGLKSVAQSGGAQSDVYAMFLTPEAWDRHRLTKEELALVKEAEEAAKPKPDSAAGSARGAPGGAARRDSTPKLAKPLELDLENAPLRRARLTIHSSSLGDALVSKDGETLYYLARFERGMNLWSTNLRTRETKMVLALDASGGSMVWDREQKNIFLLSGGTIAKIDPAGAKREAVTIAGETTVDDDAERAADFDHVWRKVRETFYTAGYHGADWDALRATYERHLPGVGNGHEMAELHSEMLGELNVSHSGASFGSTSPTDDATASLGIFYDQRHTGAGVRIEEVLRDGPLDKAGMNVKPGAIIESIDGVANEPQVDFNQLLNRRAGDRVLVVLLEGGKRRELVVKPITQAEQNALLYTRWVRRNQEEVDRASNGQLGYVHIPGMNDGAYRTTFEEVMGRWADRKGLVVDTRFNGGGDLVADLAMFLSGRQFFDYTTDTRSSGFEPNFRWTRPSVSLANEANYSDGHCYAFAYKELGLGTLVGMPVPGTCTFAGWESLPSGVRWGVPGLGVKETFTGTYLENRQTEPDLMIRNDHDVAAKGKDQQLEAAIAELLGRIRPGAE